MPEAVIVSTARTPIGRAYRGAFNDTQAQELIGHAVRHAVERAGVEGEQIEDVVIGAALQQGSTAMNIGRQAALRAGLPVSVAGMSVDRQCASGLMAIATASKQVVMDGMDIVVGGGVDSISLVQNEHMNTYRAQDPWLVEHVPATYMSMLETAEVVARRYGISREAQDEYALESQRRTAAAQEAGGGQAVALFLPQPGDPSSTYTVWISQGARFAPRKSPDDVAVSIAVNVDPGTGRTTLPSRPGHRPTTQAD